MFRALAILALSCASLHATAQSTKDTTVEHVDLDSITVSAEAGPAKYRATTPTTWDITHTRIALSFDGIRKTAAVREWIKLHPHYYPIDTLVLDAKSLEFDSILLSDKKPQSLRYNYKNDQVTIYLPRKYTANDSIEIYLRYTAMPYGHKTGGSAAIQSDRGLYFINTDHRSPYKPAQIWTQGETESNSHWMATIDKPNSRFTLQVEMTVADSLTTLSNGALAKQMKLPGGMRTDIWKTDKPIQAYAAMMAIGRFSVIKDKWQGKEVNYYVEPQYAPYARAMFHNTTEMLSFFSQKTGVAYPWNKYSQVVVRDYVSGAMENTTASLFSDFMNETTREIEDAADGGSDHEDIVSHELFHQWFGDFVSCESWSNLTLSESFANYGEQLWRMHKYGKLSADRLAWSDLNIYLMSSPFHDPELVRFKYDSREEMFDAISYHKGGAILHYLHTLMGDDAFERSMKTYLTAHAYGTAEAHDWRMAIEQVTGLDWNWFFNQWYYYKGHPELKIAYTYDDVAQKLSVSVKQVQDDSTMVWQLPMKTAIITGNNVEIVDWNIDRKSHTFTYSYKDGKRPVVVPDCLHVLPAQIKEDKKPSEWLVQMQHMDDYVSRRLAIQAASKQMSDSAAQATLDMGLRDSIGAIRTYALAQIGNAFSDRYRKRWMNDVVAATADKDREVRAEAFDVLAKWKADAAKQKMVAALSDTSYAVSASALKALDKIDKDTAYIAARNILSTGKAGGKLFSAIWPVLAAKGNADDISFFLEYAPRAFGGKRQAFATPLNMWLREVKSDEAFGKGADLYADLIIYETMSSTRATIGGLFFQAVSSQKTRAKDEDKAIATTAKTRLVMLKKAADRIDSEEQDPETKKKFEKLVKDNFSEEE
ncbi:MAG: M1 family peptidase [Taibaiella sp.]|nr:M1 family peptidase [Taibaiella sp.]